MTDNKIIFITGTDTGVGKTLLTGLLLHHLRESGIRALAMKPFCSGGRADIRLLQSLQRGELSDSEMNPYYFAQPVAPLVAAKKGRALRLPEVIQKIKNVAARCDCLLIEGSGGLLVPLAQHFTVADLIAALDCWVIIAARNRLGTINHTLLTCQALRARRISNRRQKVVLMSPGTVDLSSRTNQKVLTNLLRPTPVFAIPFLGQKASNASTIRNNHPKIKRTLTLLATFDRPD